MLVGMTIARSNHLTQRRTKLYGCQVGLIAALLYYSTTNCYPIVRNDTAPMTNPLFWCQGKYQTSTMLSVLLRTKTPDTSYSKFTLNLTLFLCSSPILHDVFDP